MHERKHGTFFVISFAKLRISYLATACQVNKQSVAAFVGPHVVTACYTAAELQTILTLALQLVRTAQTHSLGSPFLVRQTLPN